MIRKQLTNSNVVLSLVWRLEEGDILYARCLCHLPVYSGNIRHFGILDVHNEVAQLSEEVVLADCQQRETITPVRSDLPG